jgi:hypothetical protein
MSNWWRNFWNLNQARTYSIYADGAEIAIVHKMTHKYTSFTVVCPATNKRLSSAILHTGSFHGHENKNGMQWYISPGVDNSVSAFNASRRLDDASSAALEEEAKELVDKVFGPQSERGSTEEHRTETPLLNPTSAPLATTTPVAAVTTTSTTSAAVATTVSTAAATTSGTTTSTSTTRDRSAIPYFVSAAIILPDAYAMAKPPAPGASSSFASSR